MKQFIIILLFSSHIYGDELKFNFNDYYFSKSLYKPFNYYLYDDYCILKYSLFNLFDKNIATTVALTKDKNNTSLLDLAFITNYKINKIIIYNGYQKNSNVYLNNDRPKSINLLVYKYENGKKFNISFDTNIILLDITNSQTILFNDVDGWYWGFGILSTYPGSKYNDICISEIEFWYNDEKYEVDNLEEAKKEYMEQTELVIKKQIYNGCFEWFDGKGQSCYIYFDRDGLIYQMPDREYEGHLYARYWLNRGVLLEKNPNRRYNWKNVGKELYIKGRNDDGFKVKRYSEWTRVDMSIVKVIGYHKITNGVMYVGKKQDKMTPVRVLSNSGPDQTIIDILFDGKGYMRDDDSVDRLIEWIYPESSYLPDFK